MAGNVYYFNLRGLMEELEILFYTAFESLISIDSSKWCLKCVFLKNENLFRDVFIDRLVYLFKWFEDLKRAIYLLQYTMHE